jgi:hypothetical protein
LTSKEASVVASRGLWWLLLALALLALVACPDDDSNPTEPQGFVFLFVPDGPSRPNGVTLEVEADGAGLQVRALADQISDLHSYRYTVSLPAGLLRFAGGTLDLGTLLVGATGSGEADDDSFSFDVSLPDDAPGQSGTGTVGSVGRYDMVAAGQGRVDFSEASFLDSFGRPLEGLSLIGGTLEVRPSG